MKSKRLLVLVCVVLMLASIACSCSVDFDLGGGEKTLRRQPTQLELQVKAQERHANNMFGLLWVPLLAGGLLLFRMGWKGVGWKTWIIGILFCLINIGVSLWVLTLGRKIQEIAVMVPYLGWFIVIIAAWAIEPIDCALRR